MALQNYQPQSFLVAAGAFFSVWVADLCANVTCIKKKKSSLAVDWLHMSLCARLRTLAVLVLTLAAVCPGRTLTAQGSQRGVWKVMR